MCMRDLSVVVASATRRQGICVILSGEHYTKEVCPILCFPSLFPISGRVLRNLDFHQQVHYHIHLMLISRSVGFIYEEEY